MSSRGSKRGEEEEVEVGSQEGNGGRVETRAPRGEAGTEESPASGGRAATTQSLAEGGGQSSPKGDAQGDDPGGNHASGGEGGDSKESKTLGGAQKGQSVLEARGAEGESLQSTTGQGTTLESGRLGSGADRVGVEGGVMQSDSTRRGRDGGIMRKSGRRSGSSGPRFSADRRMAAETLEGEWEALGSRRDPRRTIMALAGAEGGSRASHTLTPVPLSVGVEQTGRSERAAARSAEGDGADSVQRGGGKGKAKKVKEKAANAPSDEQQGQGSEERGRANPEEAGSSSQVRKGNVDDALVQFLRTQMSSECQ